jgi:hypothetical protein
VRLASLWHLVRLSLARDVRGALSSAFGVAMGVGTLVFFVGLGLGVGRIVREQIFPVEARLVQVVPPALSVGSLLGGGALDEAAVERLAALPAVQQVHRRMNVRVPVVSRFDGDFFGRRLRFGVELLAVGVEPSLFEGDVPAASFQDRGPDAPIPGVLSTRLLEIYNKSFAPARKLPQLSPKLLEGFTAPLELNRSWIGAPTGGPAIQAQVQVVGVSSRGVLAGITIPLETARRINRTAGEDAETYTGVTLELVDPSGVPEVTARVRAMGLEVDDEERELAQTAGAAVLLTTSALAFLSLLICVLAAVNIAHALSANVRAREKELGVYRAVGARKRDVRSLVMAEGVVLGLVGGLAGTLAARLLGLAVDVAATRMLPEFPFKPDTFFSFPPAVWLGGVLLGVLAALVGSWGPARRASATDPSRVLAG